MFKKLLAKVGVGGASVDAELDSNQVRPGETIHGRVRMTGGNLDQEIQGAYVSLVARIPVSDGEVETIEDVEFDRTRIADSFTLETETEREFPFSLDLPWETPPNVIEGRPLRRIEIGLRTQLAIAGALDGNDLDPLEVHALPAQEHILQTLVQLGFEFHKADLEPGEIRGMGQRLPFFQEIELRPTNSRYSGLNELEVSFVTGPTSMELVLEADKKDGLFIEGSDTFGHFTVEHAGFADHDWSAALDEWLTEVGRRRGWFGVG